MTQFVLANQTPQDEVGRTLPKARLYFYENNTFNFKDVYSDTARTSVLPNPVIADGDGRFPAIYLAVNSNYRVHLKDRFDKQVTPFLDNQGEAAQGLATEGTFTPSLVASFTTNITEGPSATFEGSWILIAEQLFLDFFINFDDAGAVPVVGSRFILDGLPSDIRPLNPPGIYSAGSGTLNNILTSSSFATYDVRVENNGGRLHITCMQVIGGVNYGDTIGGRVSYRIN